MQLFQTARRRLMIGALAACGAMALGATAAHAQGSSGVTDKEIRIGAWIPLTGPIAVVGVPQKAGFETYINMVNDRGGINGRKITWVVEDNAKVFVEGLRRVKGPLTRQSLKEAIESLKNYDSGILAPASFGADRHLGLTATQRVQLTGNRWVPVGTPVDGDKDW